MMVLTCCTTAVATGAPVHAQPTMQSHIPPSVEPSQPGAAAAVDISKPAPVRPTPSGCPAGGRLARDMNMCVPEATRLKAMLMFQLNQYAVYSQTAGPRGMSRLTGPGAWMLNYDSDLTARNHLAVNVMASPEQLTVGVRGTPQLLQTENLDAMHPHDTIMAFEFRDTFSFGPDDSRRLTLLFAPRGEAAIGPVPFMHRDSAEGNPDAPLGHSLQDGFHDASTVYGVDYRTRRWEMEFTGFSGRSISRPFPLHGVDSYAVRLNHDINDHLRIGASYVDALLADDAGIGRHNQFASGWLATSHPYRGGELKTAFVWGATRGANGVDGRKMASSFLEEGAYQRGANKFYGRAEILQITPPKLEIATSDNVDRPRWVKAFTAGYERTLVTQPRFSIFAGASYTKDLIPAEFEPAYGSDASGLKIYLRLKFRSAAGKMR